LCEVDEIYQVGGAQAIGALAYGTETIPSVDKIFGPGNRYVTEAKSQVSRVCAIDMPAGPSEVMVVIDKNSNYAFAAADLLSQAEHGPDSQIALVVYCSDVILAHQIIDEVENHLKEQLKTLPRKEIATKVIDNGRAFVALDEKKLLEIIDNWAAEHLILQCDNYSEIAKKVNNAASLFLGPYSCESAGDYASGTNHTLPTNFWARSHSGISLQSFLKRLSFQEIAKEGLETLSETIVTLAGAEGLEAHSRAVKIRMEGK
ncbi:MAG: histidinol dehydrogenase, partial [Sphaerochaetaceae bacterium]